MEWAKFPDPTGVVEMDANTKIVSMPLDYWRALTQYVIDTDAGIKTIEAYRDVN